MTTKDLGDLEHFWATYPDPDHGLQWFAWYVNRKYFFGGMPVLQEVRKDRTVRHSFIKRWESAALYPVLQRLIYAAMEKKHRKKGRLTGHYLEMAAVNWVNIHGMEDYRTELLKMRNFREHYVALTLLRESGYDFAKHS